ncbi:hypothetical protein [Fodinicola feengrottensis]|uniref:hypothetical protein n=1 Tax=Fodinicola feengrottensis TaxID=435914 RepID=UPI0013D87118|nr:hypothetical protein [Fodinicola feengrottensis]
MGVLVGLVAGGGGACVVVQAAYVVQDVPSGAEPVADALAGPAFAGAESERRADAAGAGAAPAVGTVATNTGGRNGA